MSNREDVLDTNKVGSIIGVNILEDMKITKISPESMYNIFSWSRFGIQSSQSWFKCIKFGNSKRRQARKQVRYEDVMVSISNILVIEINNCLWFKNNIKYVKIKFIQANKITKELMTILFTNLNLTLIRKYQGYNNI